MLIALTILASLLLAPLATLHAAELELAAHQQSRFVIYRDAASPSTVRKAAEELQSYLRKASGAKLAIVDRPTSPMLCLGDNAPAREAGVRVEDLAWEGYRILTKDGSLYIAGRDTADGQSTPRGGTSPGTRNGVYAFLEEQLGIRWLLPGEDGEVVPELRTVTVGPKDRTGAPIFLRRMLPYTGANAEVVLWQTRQRLGGSLSIYHGHNWAKTVPAELFKTHPEWFAMRGGERVPPLGRYKLETTNPELVAYYADAAIKTFDATPSLYGYSLSPSDSSGWSESPESLALTERDPHGGRSVTPLVLKFYDDVARRVAARHPDRVLPGYIYSEYLYPPAAGIPPLAPNLFPVVAPHISYGFTLYRDDVRKDWQAVMDAWGNAASHLGYYDLMNTWQQQLGAPMPVATSIVRFVFENLRRCRGMQSVYLYGRPAWGAGAASNYVLARMMWNPAQDPDTLRKEFFHLAYGPQAGASILAMDDLLDAAFAREYQTNDQARYIPVPDMLRRIFSEDHFGRIRQLYGEALKAALTGKQHRRLEMLGQNLSLLESNLISRKLVTRDTASPFYRADKDIVQMMADPQNWIALGELQSSQPEAAPPAVQVRLSETGPVPTLPMDQDFRVRGNLRVVFYPLADDQIEVTPRILSHSTGLLTYTVQNTLGETFARGVLSDGVKTAFVGRSREPLVMTVRGSAIYGLRIAGAPYAMRSLGEARKSHLHLIARTTPLYVYAPPGAEKWTLTLSTDAPGETAAATVLDPLGKAVAELTTVAKGTVRAELSNPPGGGFWCIRFNKPSSGTVDDVRLQIDGLDSYFITDPALALLVSEPKR